MASGVTIPIPLQTRDDRRRAERFAAAMPVTIDGRPGTTEDLSTTGLSFVADHAYALGDRVEVVIEYLMDGHQYPLRCEAEVVRVEPCAEGYRVGARLAAQSQIQDIAVGEPGAHLRSVD